MGIHARRIVVSLPGSPTAGRLALEKLLLPELGHLVREVSR
jgi:molybdenum cofactor biosynthesis protein B